MSQILVLCLQCFLGTYGVPAGTIFSLPVCFHPRGYWRLVEDLELASEVKLKIADSLVVCFLFGLFLVCWFALSFQFTLLTHESIIRNFSSLRQKASSLFRRTWVHSGRRPSGRRPRQPRRRPSPPLCHRWSRLLLLPATVPRPTPSRTRRLLFRREGRRNRWRSARRTILQTGTPMETARVMQYLWTMTCR